MPSFSMCLTLIRIVKYHMVTPAYFEGPNDTTIQFQVKKRSFIQWWHTFRKVHYSWLMITPAQPSVLDKLILHAIGILH